MRSVLFSLVAFLAACASGPPYASGYLGDYSDLGRSASDPDLWEWRHPGADFSVYDKLVVEPALIRPGKGSSAKGLGHDALLKTAEDLRAALVAGAPPRWTVVPRGGPRTLRLQVVLVDVTKDAVAYEAEVVDTITASRLIKQVRRVPWPSATLSFQESGAVSR
ncbi:MAG: DUF3313 domain-containing protein [Planctomycetes bacterium]|nr:DUF3313 domain-containing protein [Planctomycetota bacterium]